MKFSFDKETDSLYLKFNDKSGVDSIVIKDDYIADVDENGKIVGIEILNVSDNINLDSIIFNNLKAKNLSFVE